jgi:hypothetical protein
MPGAFALTLRAPGAIHSNELLCVVATFGAIRVGVWHNRVGRDKAYQIFLSAEEAAKVDASSGSAYAALIRSTYAPLLCEYSMPVVRSWLRYSTIDALVGMIVPARSSEAIPFEEESTRRSGWLNAVGLCYDGADRRHCRVNSDEDAHSIWRALMPDAIPAKLRERPAEVFMLVKKLASISPFLARDVVSRYLTLANTGTEFQQWRLDLRQVLVVSDRDCDALGSVAGSTVNPDFFSRNLRADATGGDLTIRNQNVLFGLGERLPSNISKQYYFSRIL